MRLIDIEPYEKHSSAHMLCVLDEGKLVQVFSSDIPTIEAEPVKHGQWILKDKNGNGVCSNCHRQDNIDPLATHCRYCGADMRGDCDD
jgi:Fe2+ or Zn2+ uptake regulation protein